MAKNTAIQKITAAELEALAKKSATQAAKVGGGGAFFSTRGGVLSFDGAPVPNNEMGVILLDFVYANAYYESEYDPDAIVPPDCFAFGRDPAEMAPPEVASNKQGEQCEGCPQNEWASGKGRGKACANRARVLLISGGTMMNGRFKPFTTAEQFTEAPLATLQVPVTSVPWLGQFVKQIANSLNRPQWTVFTKVKVVPDEKSQFKVTFEAMTQVPTELLGVLKARVDEAEKAAEAFTYSPKEEEPTPAKKVKGKAKTKRF